MPNRFDRIRRRLEEQGADALLLSFLPNIRWACGFTGSNGLLLVGPEQATFVTDGRYTEQARQEVSGADVIIARNGLMTRLMEGGHLEGYSQVIFEADDVTVSKRQQLEEECSTIEWQPISGLLTRDVAVKEDPEIRQIRRAQAVTEAVFDYILTQVEPGRSEREIAAEIIYDHLRRGAEKMAFDPIVASGPNAARPHARPTDRTLQEGDLVVLDMGCILDGYASDMTRTVAIGDPGSAAREGYELVRRAQKQALEHARAGLKAKEIDAMARDVIAEEGMEEYFSHGLGHGIGLQVHEWPRVSHASEDELPSGVCVTIEPGIYVPEEQYGVRIEDIVVLQSGGIENLTTTSKELRVL
ncbi:aminopeptidase [Salinibacter sp. 10B]|uniref:M24 family metallopeptidase n=1 Tax=Salinibacter sp. 10B TaxID=1923971 RepID=UPI000CF3A5FF|nr:Xaa-Pro peptidase family protein [Salinibacter sp. 10B]PQJ33469.1 aminopeptidase [Salinibacter sp. 10B]